MGCGVCAVLVPDAFSIIWTSIGSLAARVDNAEAVPDLVDLVCPFASGGANETEIGEKQFAGKRHPILGRYEACFTGYVAEGVFRRKGSSGGVGKWILAELLRSGEVDYVVQVRAIESRAPLFAFARFDSADSVIQGARSAYYPVSLADALRSIKERPGRYAVTALPCFSKAVRRLAEQDQIIKERVRFIIATVCGHLKTTAYAELLAWQVGVPPGELRGIDFREKIPGRRANEKGVVAADKGGARPPRSSKELFGGNWGWNFFKYKACDYCDDIMAETADVTLGDAWLPGLVEDSAGNNVVVVRDATIERIMREGIERGRLALETCSPETVVLSQRGGVRHKTEGLALRLHDDACAGRWAPRKRVNADAHLPERRKHIYRSRVDIRERCHATFRQAVESEDLEKFVSAMRPLVRELKKRKIFQEIKRLVRRMFRWSP